MRASAECLASCNWPALLEAGSSLARRNREPMLLTGAGSWPVPLPLESDMREHWPDHLCQASGTEVGPLITCGSQCVLGAVPGRLVMLGGQITWLSCLWVEGPSLMWQNESGLHAQMLLHEWKCQIWENGRLYSFQSFSNMFCSKPVYLYVWKSGHSLT